MDENHHDGMIDEVRRIALTVNGIVDTEKCFIRKAGTKYHIDLHAVVDGNISVTKGHELSHHLKDALIENLPNLGQVLIHIEPDK